MEHLILGVDPGLKGGWAVFSTKEQQMKYWGFMPLIPKGKKKQINPHFLARDWSKIPLTLAVIELVTARPGQGVVSMFTFGQTLGIVEGIAAALKLPIIFVAPQRWKGCLKLSADKKEAIKKACFLFPRLPCHEGICEAALIALYGALYHDPSTHALPVSTTGGELVIES